REGARAKRARKPPSTHGGPPDRAPSALTGHSPTPLTAPWGRNPKRPPDKSPGRRPGGGANKTDFSPVERKGKGGVRPKAGRGRERSEPGNNRRLTAVLRTAPPRP